MLTFKVKNPQVKAMILKNLKFSLLPLVFLLTMHSSQGAPLMSIGDVGTVSFTGQTVAKWDSNIFRQENGEVSDKSLIFSPGLSAIFGRNASNLDIGASTSLDFVRYQDRDELDSELFHFQTTAAYQSGRIQSSAMYSFDESKSNNELTNVAGDLVERESEKINLSAEYTLSPKFSFKLGHEIDDAVYTGTYAATFSDRAYTRTPVNVFYELTPKLDLSFGYVRADIDVDGSSNDATTDTFNVGFRGELLPKLTGNLKVGFVDYENEGGTRDETTLSLKADLNWKVSSKISHRLDLFRDFDAASTGFGTAETKVRWNTSYALDSKTLLSGRVGYNIRDYLSSNREDSLLTLGLNGSYRLNNYWNLNAGYVFSKNDSNLDGSSYDDNIITFSAAITY